MWPTLPGGSMDDMYEMLWEYTSHALNYDELVARLREYADAGYADAEAFRGIAELIERVVPRSRADLPFVDAVGPGIVMVLHGFYGEGTMDVKHKDVIKKLITASGE